MSFTTVYATPSGRVFTIWKGIHPVRGGDWHRLMEFDTSSFGAEPTALAEFDTSFFGLPNAFRVSDEAGFATLRFGTAGATDHTRVSLSTGEAVQVASGDVPDSLQNLLLGDGVVVTPDGHAVQIGEDVVRRVDLTTWGIEEFPIEPGFSYRALMSNRGIVALRQQSGGGGDLQWVWLGDGSDYQLLGSPHPHLPGPDAVTFYDGYFYVFGLLNTGDYRRAHLWRTNQIQAP